MITHSDFSMFLQSLHSDIRFEVILTDLLSENLDMDDVVIESKSLFKRSYHHDIESAGEIDYGAGKKKRLCFTVNRDGIYDQLPEDLFHHVAETNNASDKYEVIREIQEHQTIEKQSRLFFQPLEHEFYSQRVRLEIEERKFLFETNDTLPGEIFNRLWHLPEFLDDLQKSQLGLLMPVIHKLTGKKDLLSFVFESITGDPVEIREAGPCKYEISENPVLGQMKLGADTILGGCLGSLQAGYSITIFVSDMANLPDYMPSGKKITLHEYLCSLFMPLDAEFFFETRMTKNYTVFFIENDSVFQGRLNYTTII